MRTTNKTSRRDRSALIIVLAAFGVLLAAAAAALLLTGGQVASAGGASIGGPFQLVAGNGQTVTDQQYRGKYLLVYFGYTSCPDVCPTTLQEVARSLDLLGAAADRLQPLFITVDPARDTPKVMADYTQQFSPRLVGLTGTPEAVAAVEKAYRVFAEIHRTGSGAGDYSVDHSSVLYLMGPDGRFVEPLRADEKAPELAADLKRALS